MALTRQDLLLLLLYAPMPDSGSIAGRTRLAKIMFIFREEAWEESGFEDVLPRGELPEFAPWRFGPFSKELSQDVSFFTRIGFVEAHVPDNQPQATRSFERAFWLDEDPEGEGPRLDRFVVEEFTLTELGTRYVEDEGLWDALSEGQQEALIHLKHRFVMREALHERPFVVNPITHEFQRPPGERCKSRRGSRSSRTTTTRHRSRMRSHGGSPLHRRPSAVTCAGS